MSKCKCKGVAYIPPTFRWVGFTLRHIKQTEIKVRNDKGRNCRKRKGKVATH